MSSTARVCDQPSANATVIKMFEPLPLEVQNQVAEHLHLYDLQDEAQWDEAFNRTQESLVTTARRAKQEIAEGQAQTMNYGQLQ